MNLRLLDDETLRDLQADLERQLGDLSEPDTAHEAMLSEIEEELHTRLQRRFEP